MSDISKNELMSLLKTHEERETKEQEDAESKEEQRLEAKAGIHDEHHKKAFWRGFDRKSKT